ncbi:MAG: type II secretion system protein GspG [Planctomycetaceae bacterium]
MKRTQRKGRARRKGFTLMEVLLVLAILGVIAAMVVPQLLGQLKGAKIRTAKLDIKNIESMLKIYATAHDDEFTETLDEMVTPKPLADGTQPKPYLEKSIDPWGNKYNYVAPGDNNPHFTDGIHAAIWSNGPNGTNEQGSGDDVNNWTDREREAQNSN